MSPATILDAGPLTAFFRKTDEHWRWARDSFAQVGLPLITCEAVLTEVLYLLRGTDGVRAVVDSLRQHHLTIGFSLSNEIVPVGQLLGRYRDQGISLADACLVRMSELHENCRVMTLDRDFLVYRRFGRRQIPLIAPFA